ncbi:MAG: response regulator transcription factor [Bacilli bacterium]|nr:response regulator transcription factor [Bacilli bacterium]
MNIFILDDEEVIVDSLGSMLKSIGSDKDNIYGYTDYRKFLEDIKTRKCDILFIDIRLDNTNGIELIKENGNYLKGTKLIYITGYDEYIEDVFETELVYLIKKPLSKEKVEKAYLKAIEKINKENKVIVVKTLKETRKVKINEIYYIESDARLVNIHLKNEVLVSYGKLSDMEEMLKGNFLRTHKSYLVNLERVKSYKHNQVILDNGKVIPISRNSISKVKNEIFDYVKEEV